MKPAVAILYILTGLSLALLDMVTTGAMLGMTEPISPWRSVMWVSFFTLGPCLLILGGIATATKPETRIWWLAGLATAIVVLLGIWTVPRIGWSYAGSMFLLPYAVGFVVALAAMLLVKRARPISLLGALIAAPVIYDAGHGVKNILFGNEIFTPLFLWILIPSALVLASILTAITVRLP